ncbi:MAG: 1-acyl-sn-glycerol-3-phosphate acyltransferase [Planctomycetales bacterium]|nr:1-acyl-sn-glycerol-3-phosphate acyltransferase [Planctomycetales bacterium]
MQNVVIEEPYEFVPPVYGKFWPWIIKKYLNRHLRKNLGIHSIECRELPRLAASLEAGHGVLLAPNHCRMSDPLTLNQIAQQLHCSVHAMASWHLFKQDRLTRFVLRRMGAFSVYREGVDRQAINTAVDILVDGKRPLVVFPEGAISRHNDILMPMMEGTSFIARTAAKRRQKLGLRSGVVVHPIAIRYFFRGDLLATITPVLEEIESHFSWYPQRDRPLIPRLQQIAQALLSLKEIEYFGSARTGDFYERVDRLIEDELAKLEKEWKIKTNDEGIVGRVKNLRTAILPDMVKNNISAEERHRRWKQLAACYYVQQMSHYPRKYVRTSEPNIPEHILETVERFEEDFTDRVSTNGPFHVVLQVGEAIEVDSRRDREANSDPIMDGIRTQLTEMLTTLSAESPRMANC